MALNVQKELPISFLSLLPRPPSLLITSNDKNSFRRGEPKLPQKSGTQSIIFAEQTDKLI